MMDDDSSQILRRLQQGGAVELTELFMRLRVNLRAMVDARLDRRLLPRVDASDIVQETFVRASKNLESYLQAPVMHPVIWLRLIGKHVIAETRRRHFRDKRSPVKEQNWDHADEDLLVNKLTDSMRSVGSIVGYQEMVQNVRSKLQLLSDMDREMLEMRHVDGMSLEDAAAALEINVETAKKRYYRALKRFRLLANEILS